MRRDDWEDNSPSSSIQRAECPNDRSSRGITLEALSCSFAHDVDLEAAADKLCALGPSVHRGCHPVERELECGVGDSQAREHLGSEEACVQAPIAPDWPESVSGATGGRHSRSPVGIHPQLVRSKGERRVSRHERDRLRGDPGEPRLELRDGLPLAESAYVDSRDLCSLRELLARAGER